MGNALENAYTIVRFMDSDASLRVYRGEKLLHNLENAELSGFELALIDFKAQYRFLNLWPSRWEDMADFAFAIEWKKQPLSDLLTAVIERGFDVEVYRERPASESPDSADSTITAAL